MTLFIWITALIATVVSYRNNRGRTLDAIRKSLNTLKNLAPGVLTMIALVGLTLAVFPEQSLAKLFNVSGFRGLFLVSAIGALVNIPGPIAFPLAGTLLKIGVNPAVLASFITTLTMVGIVTSPLEISNFGLRFTVLRQLFSFFSAIAIGLVMGGLL